MNSYIQSKTTVMEIKVPILPPDPSHYPSCMPCLSMMWCWPGAWDATHLKPLLLLPLFWLLDTRCVLSMDPNDASGVVWDHFVVYTLPVTNRIYKISIRQYLRRKTQSPRAQTTRPASFGPVFVIYALCAPYFFNSINIYYKNIN